MSTLKEKVYGMPHITFQRTILKNVEPTKEYQKLYKHGPSSLTKEEKVKLANVIIENVGRDNLKLPITDDDFISFTVATTIRMAKHK